MKRFTVVFLLNNVPQVPAQPAKAEGFKNEWNNQDDQTGISRFQKPAFARTRGWYTPGKHILGRSP